MASINLNTTSRNHDTPNIRFAPRRGSTTRHHQIDARRRGPCSSGLRRRAGSFRPSGPEITDMTPPQDDADRGKAPDPRYTKYLDRLRDRCGPIALARRWARAHGRALPPRLEPKPKEP
jgi:hypothetical protein